MQQYSRFRVLKWASHYVSGRSRLRCDSSFSLSLWISCWWHTAINWSWLECLYGGCAALVRCVHWSWAHSTPTDNPPFPLCQTESVKPDWPPSLPRIVNYNSRSGFVAACVSQLRITNEQKKSARMLLCCYSEAIVFSPIHRTEESSCSVLCSVVCRHHP